MNIFPFSNKGENRYRPKNYTREYILDEKLQEIGETGNILLLKAGILVFSFWQHSFALSLASLEPVGNSDTTGYKIQVILSYAGNRGQAAACRI